MEDISSYLVQVPDLEHGFPIMQWVFKQAVPCWKGIEFAPQNRSIRQDKALEQLEIMLTNGIADVDWSAGDGPGGGMESCTRMSRLEHVPVWVYEVAHPKAVVGTVDHVTPLKPKCAIGNTLRIGAPKIITYSVDTQKSVTRISVIC